MKVFVVIFAFLGLAHSSPPNLNYDFTGFKKLTQFLPTTCSDIEGQIIRSIGGIQKPTHNYAHIQCVADETMGTRTKFIIHRDQDDDPCRPGDTTRQRLEMHSGHRNDLHAYKGSTFVYAWWFFLSSHIVAGTSYWHIFQLKATGSNTDPNPTFTFTLKSNYGFMAYYEDLHGTNTILEMLPLSAATGKWIQASVKVNYATSGYADITFKDVNGGQLYHQKVSGNFWWDGAEFYGPKWGLYRHRDEKFNDDDYMFFQNVQIWKN